MVSRPVTVQLRITPRNPGVSISVYKRRYKNTYIHSDLFVYELHIYPLTYKPVGLCARMFVNVSRCLCVCLYVGVCVFVCVYHEDIQRRIVTFVCMTELDVRYPS